MATLKSNFAVKSKYETFYTGGKIQLSKDGQFMFCGCGNKVNVLEVATGKVHVSIGQEEDEEITSFCVTPNDKYVIIATQHLLLRQWDWKEQKLIRTWKAIHFAPVVCMGFDCTSTLLATGSADSTIKVWDIEKQYCTHNLRGHQGIISVVAFHPDISRLQLISAGEDYKVRIWNLQNSKCEAETGAHFSLVTSVCFSQDGNTIYTSGRDGVVCLMDAKSFKLIKTVPVFEVIETVVVLPENCEYPAINVDKESAHFLTAGSRGILRLWNATNGKCVYTTDTVHVKHQSVTPPDATLAHPEDANQNIVQLLYNSAQNTITVVTFDQNISILGLEKLRLQKQFAGNNDEILDVKYFGEDSQHAVVATNSPHIKVFELETWDCEILYGHTDIVLCIDVIHKTDMFLSGGKDNTIRLWKVNQSQKGVACLAVCQGHTNAVGTLAVARLKSKFFVSGSEDCTLKLWMLPTDLDPAVTTEIHAVVTEKAHDKTISSVVVAPNDKFVATGSMDKTAKLWNAKDLSLVGVMRGHKRGIWCVQFSPIDQILASSSGDGVVKLWSLSDFSCVRTFEGHDCAVLKVTFVTRGMQLLSSGTNGLVKLWTIKSNECVKTFDEHEDKVWALAVHETENTFITGGADSNLIIWKDVTETEQNEAREKQEQFILQEQELSNLIQQKKYLKAIGLAITLEQPFRLLNILKEIMSSEGGDVKLHDTMAKLRMDQIDALLRFCVQWNTNSRHSHEAQVVVSSVLKMYPPTQLKQLGNLKSTLEGLVPYTERHFKRMSRLVQQSMFLEYTWQCMKGMSAVSIEENLRMVPETFGQETSTAADDKSDDSSSSESEVEIEQAQKTKPKLTANIKHPVSLHEASVSDSSSDDSSESEDEDIVKVNVDTARPSKNVNDATVENSESSGDESSSESGLEDNLSVQQPLTVDEDDDISSASESSDSSTEGQNLDTQSKRRNQKVLGTEYKTTQEQVLDSANVNNNCKVSKSQKITHVNQERKGKASLREGKAKTPKQRNADTELVVSDQSPAGAVQVTLTKGYLPKENKKPSKGQTLHKGRTQKRKITDEFSVVKEPTENSSFVIDRKASKLDLANENTQKQTRSLRKQTKSSTLLKKPRKL